MSKYTLQFITESGSFSAPRGTDVEVVKSKKALQAALECWHSEVQSLSEYDGRAFVFYGALSDVTDVYPDALASIGKRGGLNLSAL